MFSDHEITCHMSLSRGLHSRVLRFPCKSLYILYLIHCPAAIQHEEFSGGGLFTSLTVH